MEANAQEPGTGCSNYLCALWPQPYSQNCWNGEPTQNHVNQIAVAELIPEPALVPFGPHNVLLKHVITRAQSAIQHVTQEIIIIDKLFGATQIRPGKMRDKAKEAAQHRGHKNKEDISKINQLRSSGAHHPETLRHRIIARATPGVAPANPLCRENATLAGPIFVNRLSRII